MNLPMVPRAGDAQFLKGIDELFIPIINQFKPDIVLVSAGFDTHFSDPITQLNITIPGYGEIIKKVKEGVKKVCDGKIVILLEGGYDLKSLSRGILTEISVLGELGIEFIDDTPKIEEGIVEYNNKMIDKIKEVFSPYWNF